MGFSDYELMTSFRRSRILKHYQFMGEIAPETKSMENAKMLESDEPDMQTREDCLVYFRTIDRQMKTNWAWGLDGVAKIPTIARKPSKV